MGLGLKETTIDVYIITRIVGCYAIKTTFQTMNNYLKRNMQQF